MNYDMPDGHNCSDRNSLRGGPFSTPVSIGQMYYPDDQDLKVILRRIYDNSYYTNHGPLAKEFEFSLSRYLNTKNTIVTTNSSLGLMMTLVGLGIKGTVAVPAFGPAGIAESVAWTGLTPVFCDIDEQTGHLTVDTVKKSLRKNTSAIIAVSLWGNVCEYNSLASYAYRAGLEFIHFAVDAFGVTVNGKKVGSEGITTIFSFDPSKFLSSGGGGCVVTNDELLARRIRNIRSSYGAGPFEKVSVTANGRFSEVQAAIGLWSLSRLEGFRRNNKTIYETYKQRLTSIDGLNIIGSGNSVISNYQDIALNIDCAKYGFSCNDIRESLQKKNIDTNTGYGLSQTMGDVSKCPAARRLSSEFIQLPIGSHITPEMAEKICSLLISPDEQCHN